MTLDEIKALARKLVAELDAYQPPVIITPPPVSRVVCKTLAVGINRDTQPDRDKIKRLFGLTTDTGFWADPSTTLSSSADGVIRFTFDKARRTTNPNSGGSSWVNAAVPLSRRVAAARLTFDARFGPDGQPWGWGKSGKLPGLVCWNDGLTPGGGEVTPRNYSVRLCWDDYDKNGRDLRVGPYMYGQERGSVPDQWWAKELPQGTVRWGAPLTPPLVAKPAEWHRFTLSITPDGGRSRVEFGLDGSRLWGATLQLLGPGVKHEITHLAFVAMYGGDTLDYGPAQDVTVAEIKNLTVEEL